MGKRYLNERKKVLRYKNIKDVGYVINREDNEKIKDSRR